jgi:hypothetical protein
MDPNAWESERLDTCEGLNHEDAVPDAMHAAQQLKAATQHFQERDNAIPNKRQHGR